MTAILAALSLPLFVPADRPERYIKAFAAQPDATIIDLEDAVGLDNKERARGMMVEASSVLADAPCPVVVRVNGEATAFHAADLRAARAVAPVAVMVPKVESAETVRRIAGETGLPLLTLIESARGLAAAREIAAAGGRLVFGSFDFSADLGCAHSREALLLARLELVLAARLAGGPPPLDGVTTAIRDPDLVREDASYAATLGLGGKMLIHPGQVAPARAGFQPSQAEIEWAARVLGAQREGGAEAIDGMMIDAPVRLRAEQIQRRSAAMRSARAP